MKTIKKNSSTGFDFFSNFYQSEERLEVLESKSTQYLGKKFVHNLSKLVKSYDIDGIKSIVSECGKNSGILYCRNIEGLSLKTQILSILPNKDYVELLIDIYFTYISFLIPLLDEEVFKSDIKKLLHTDIPGTNIYRLELSTQDDIALVSLLLIILRVTYLSVIKNEDNAHQYYNYIFDNLCSEKKKVFLSDTVSLDAMEIVEHCLDLIKHDLHSCVKYFQAMVLYYNYLLISPEENVMHNTQPLSSYVSEIATRAMGLNLHRDPVRTMVKNEETESNKEVLNRKLLWVNMLILDYETSLVLNAIPTTNVDSFDTEMNISDYSRVSSELMKNLVKGYITVFPVLLFGLRLMTKLFLVKKLEFSQVIHEVSDFEVLVKERLGVLDDYLRPFEEINFGYKFIKFKLYLLSKSLISFFYHAAYCYFRKVCEPSYSAHYMRKHILVSFYEMAGISENFIKNCEQFFGPASRLFLRSIVLTFENIRVNTLTLKTGVIANLVCADLPQASAFQNSQKKEKKPLVDYYLKIKEKMEVFERTSIASLKILGRDFLRAWVFYKGCSIGIHLVSKKSTYLDDINETKTCCIHYSLQDWEDFNTALRMCTDKLSSLSEFYVSFNLNNHIGEKEVYEESSSFEVASLETLLTDNFWKAFDFLREELRKRTVAKKFKGILNSCTDTKDSSDGVNQSSNLEFFDFFDMLQFVSLEDFDAFVNAYSRNTT